MNQNKGFTFIETIVIIGILTMLTAILLLYSRGGQKQIVLLKEKAKLISSILKVKSMSINTLVGDQPTCGYGVFLETDSYSLFRDLAVNCVASDHVHTASDPQELIEKINLPIGYHLSSLNIRNILFLPPDPIVFLDGSILSNQALIIIATLDNQSSVSFKVSHAGQISE